MTTNDMAATRTKARELWSLGNFDIISLFGSANAAAKLVSFAGIQPGETVLDVATGSGPVAITAARRGARVTGLDIAPKLLEAAGAKAAVSGLEGIKWIEGDASDLEFPDASFDVVVSQFGHMFAPMPERTVAGMLRVLKPGGRIAFATWPPTGYVGRMFAMNARHVPPPPGPSPLEWGVEATIRDRLGDSVRDIAFQRDAFHAAALTPQILRTTFESYFGPTIRTVETLSSDPAKLEAWRAEWDALIGEYLKENAVPHEFLMTRAVKV